MEIQPIYAQLSGRCGIQSTPNATVAMRSGESSFSEHPCAGAVEGTGGPLLCVCPNVDARIQGGGVFTQCEDPGADDRGLQAEGLGSQRVRIHP